jgi:hypothetical protein
MQINQPLVNAHFKAIPSIGTLSTGGFTSGDLELLGGKPHGTGHVKLLVEGALLQVGADFFEVLDVAGGEGDADAVDLGSGIAFDAFFLSGWDVGGHVLWRYVLINYSLPTVYEIEIGMTAKIS